MARTSQTELCPTPRRSQFSLLLPAESSPYPSGRSFQVIPVLRRWRIALWFVCHPPTRLNLALIEE
jgi:hypothetical protein